MMLLPHLRREYDLYDIAIMTRAAPARLLGLPDRGQLGAGAIADIAVYTEQADKTAMFSAADYVFKDGELIVEKGKVKPYRWGHTHFVRPPIGSGRIEDRLRRYCSQRYAGLSHDVFSVPDVLSGRSALFKEQPCRT
jgi:formylmethanofuran dehydrogenase subunit A